MNKILNFKKIIFVGFFAAFMAVFLSAGSAQASFWDWFNLNKTNSNSQQSAATANADTTSSSSSTSNSSTSATIAAKTGDAYSITSSSATIYGTINPQGQDVSVYFKYRKESESSDATKTTSLMSTYNKSNDVTTSVKISDLSSVTKYVYRFYAYNNTSGKTISGDVKSFTTLSGTPNSSSARNSSSSSSSVKSYTLKVKINGSGRGKVISNITNDSGVGITCLSSSKGNNQGDCEVKFKAGARVQLEAKETDSNYSFGVWGKDCNNSGASKDCILIMNKDRDVSATFNAKGKGNGKDSTVSVTTTGGGAGKVISVNLRGNSDGGINCGTRASTGANDCSEVYKTNCGGGEGGEVICGKAYFKAIPDSNSTFSGWGGDCLTFGPNKNAKDQCYVNLDGAKTITANFNEGSDNAEGKNFNLIVTVSAGGVVTSTDNRINCGSGNTDCKYSYGKNGAVTLKATPNSGYSVGDYSGCSKSGNIQNGVLSCKVKMTQKRNVTINFKSSGVSSSISSSQSSSQSSSSSSLTFSTNLTVITNSADHVTSNSATLNGTVNPKDESVVYRFYYVKKGQPDTQKTTSWTSVASGSSDVSVTADISGLSSGTTYNFAISAYSYTSKKFSKIGGTQSFTTSGGSSSSSSSSSSSNQTTSSTYKLKVTISGNGRIKDNYSKIDCNSNMACQANYSKGQIITLKTDDTDGSGDSFNTKVDSWGGDCSGTANACFVTMDGDKGITVKFVSK